MDTFARFIDVLAGTLDDDVSGEAIAARLHLSRWHVDRIVSAVAGEPPARLRRRILLERAAYRLLASQDEVLTIALEAGYASHEAFTRAFARAFGEPPSTWRRRASRIELGAPGEVHFMPPGSLRLPAQRKVTPMDLVTKMVEHHVRLVGELLDRAEQVAPEVLERPIEVSVEGIDDDPTLLSLLQRLVGQLAMWEASMSNRPYDFEGERRLTLAELRALHAVSGPAFLADVARIAVDDRFDESFVDATCEPPRAFTYGGMVAHMLSWASHRRTLALGALYDAGFTELVQIAEPLEALA